MLNPTRAIVVLLLLLSGCGGCQHSEESTGGAGSAAPKAQAPAAGAAAGKIQAAPPQATVMSHPADAAQPAGSGGAPAGPAEGDKPKVEDCIVVMDGNPDFGPPPLAVTFSAEAECTSGEPKYAWSFGDGSAPSTETNPSHTYAKVGDYVASVTVTSPSGATATDELDITVEEDEAPPQ